MLSSYFELNFGVLYAAISNRYVDCNGKRLVNLGPVALFSDNKLTTSSEKHLEENNHALFVSLMYQLLTSAKECEDFSIGFDRSRDRRKQELTNIKKNRSKIPHQKIFKR